MKSKQGREWPNCKGIFGTDTFIVFVDFEGKADGDRPDFYVLSAHDWRVHVEEVARSYKSKYPHRQVEITDSNLLRLPGEVNKQGKAYEGCGVRPSQIAPHLGARHKITEFLESAGAARIPTA